MSKIAKKSFAMQMVISKRVVVQGESFERCLENCCAELLGVSGRNPVEDAGRIFALFYNHRFNAEWIDVEFCLSFDPSLITPELPADSQFNIRQIPDCIVAICTLSQGGRDSLEKAYAAIERYSHAHYDKLCYPIRETYFDFSSPLSLVEIAWKIQAVL